jgi:hypothetical protein
LTSLFSESFLSFAQNLDEQAKHYINELYELFQIENVGNTPAAFMKWIIPKIDSNFQPEGLESVLDESK